MKGKKGKEKVTRPDDSSAEGQLAEEAVISTDSKRRVAFPLRYYEEAGRVWSRLNGSLDPAKSCGNEAAHVAAN